MAPATKPQRPNEPTYRTSPAKETTAEKIADEALFEATLDATEAKLCRFKPFMASEEITLSVPIVQKYLSTKTKSGKVCDETQAARFIMLCKARGLNPFEGDAFIVGYDGQDGPQFSLITAHQAFLKRAEASNQYDGMESGVMVKIKGEGDTVFENPGDYLETNEILVGAWAKVYRKDQSHPTYRRLNLSTMNKGFGLWKTNQAGMIVKCAEADALRSAFPLSLAGMYLEQETNHQETTETKATQLPTGRHNLRRPTNGHTSPAPPAPEQVSPPEDNQAILSDVQSCIDDLGQLIEQAESGQQISEAYAAIAREEGLIGMMAATQLRDRLNAKKG